ncbi:outer membrane protein assembly factor BamA [bacterium]|nr:outer membrane protein assembly factor BamA [bacterium]
MEPAVRGGVEERSPDGRDPSPSHAEPIPWESDRFMTERMRTLWILALVVLATAGWGDRAAAQEELSGREVVEIDVVGAMTVNPRQVIAWAGLETGQTLSRNLTAGAVRRLFATRKFSDIFIYGQPTAGGVKLIVNLREFPRVRSIRFMGNDEIDDKDLREAFPVNVGQFANPSAVQRDLQPIRELYWEKGYYNVAVSTDSSVVDAGNMQDLVVSIDEGEKVKVKSITFEGNETLEDGDLRDAMEQGTTGFLRSGTFKKATFEEDEDRIITYCKDEGFLDATIEDIELNPRPDRPSELDIVITINEGRRYHVGDVNWSGNTVIDDARIAEEIYLQRGEVFSEEEYLTTLENLQTLYADRGYIYIGVEPQREIRDGVVHVDFNIVEGQPARVRDIRITGNTKTYDEVLLREFHIFPGDVFSRKRIEYSVRDAMQSGYFEEVLPDFRPVGDGGDIDLIFKVKEKQTGQFMFGAAYSAETSVSGFIQVQETNFRGKGQRLGVTWQFGSRRRYVDLSFTEPWFLGRPILLGASIFDRYQYNLDDFYESRVRGFTVNTGMRIPGTRFSRVGLRYELSETELSNFSSSYIAYLDNLEENVGVNDDDFQRLDEVDWPRSKSSVRLSFRRNSTDNPFFPTAGSNTSYSFELAGGPMGGEIDYHEHMFRSSYYQRLPLGFALHLRGMFGLIEGIEGGPENVPDYEKYRLGGNRLYPLRGYQDLEVVPRGNAPFIGGRAFTIYNAEVLYPLSRAVQLLTFLDMGDTWNSLGEADFFDLRKGAGFGIRVEVPMMGTIGFDYGYGFDRDKAGGPGWEPHFNIGTMF